MRSIVPASLVPRSIGESDLWARADGVTLGVLIRRGGGPFRAVEGVGVPNFVVERSTVSESLTRSIGDADRLASIVGDSASACPATGEDLTGGEIEFGILMVAPPVSLVPRLTDGTGAAMMVVSTSSWS